MAAFRLEVDDGRLATKHTIRGSIKEGELPNGKPGDHPYTDIVVHGRDVYSPDVAGLVREIDRLADEKGRRDLSDLLMFQFNDFSNPDVEKLRHVLIEMRDKLERDARKRGFDTSR